MLFFYREQRSKVKIKEALLLFDVRVLVGGESFWNEQKKITLEQKMFLEQNYGIEMPWVAVDGRVWPCMIFIILEWCLVALYGFTICSNMALYRLFSRS